MDLSDDLGGGPVISVASFDEADEVVFADVGLVHFVSPYAISNCFCFIGDLYRSATISANLVCRSCSLLASSSIVPIASALSEQGQDGPSQNLPFWFQVTHHSPSWRFLALRTMFPIVLIISGFFVCSPEIYNCFMNYGGQAQDEAQGFTFQLQQDSEEDLSLRLLLNWLGRRVPIH